MKSKHKTSEQIYHEIVPMPLSQLVKQILENDKYLDNIEAKIIKLEADKAIIELAFTHNGVKTAAQRVNLLQRDHLSSEVSVYPIYSETQPRSWFFPLSFMLILAVTLSVFIRSVQTDSLALGLSLLVLSVFVYLGARYLEENSGKLVEYNENDAILLLNMLKLSLESTEAEKPKAAELAQLNLGSTEKHKTPEVSLSSEKRKTSEQPQPDLEKIEPARPAVKESQELLLEDIEVANLDDETLLERKELHGKLEDLD